MEYGPLDAKLDNALMSVLCYFPCQEARNLASDARLEPHDIRTLVQRIVTLLDEYDWGDVRSREVLRAYLPARKPVARRRKPVARRVKRKEA